MLYEEEFKSSEDTKIQKQQLERYELAVVNSISKVYVPLLPSGVTGEM